MFVTRSLEGVSFHPSPRGQFSRVVDRTHAARRYSQLRASGSRSSPAAPLLLRDAEITTGAAFRMPTKIPANRTAGSVKCRPSSARRRARPVVCTPQRGLARAPRGCSSDRRHLRIAKSRCRHQPRSRVTLRRSRSRPLASGQVHGSADERKSLNWHYRYLSPVVEAFWRRSSTGSPPSARPTRQPGSVALPR